MTRLTGVVTRRATTSGDVLELEKLCAIRDDIRRPRTLNASAAKGVSRRLPGTGPAASRRRRDSATLSSALKRAFA